MLRAAVRPRGTHPRQHCHLVGPHRSLVACRYPGCGTCWRCATHAHDVNIACVDLPVCLWLCRCVAARRRSWARLRKPCATRLVMYDSLQCGAYRQRTRASTVPYVSRSTTPVLLDCGRGAGEPVLTLAWHRLWVGCADALQAVAAPCVPHDGGSVGGCSQRGVPTHGCDDGALLGGCHAAYHAA